ncbi:MAG: hypothetical protein R2788_08010 [Saprospiraceae bacterium]
MPSATVGWPDHFLLTGVFEQVARSADFQHFDDVADFFVHRKHQHLDVWVFVFYQFCRLDPIGIAHGDVHQNDIGLYLFELLQNFSPIVGFADNGNVFDIFEDRNNAIPEYFVIVGDKVLSFF